MKNDFYNKINNDLKKIKTDNLYRELRMFSGKSGAYTDIKAKKTNEKKTLEMSSNNYLGLASDERLIESAICAAKNYGIGATGSRLISGTHEFHIKLEEKLARLKKTQSAIVFSSGYTANIGVISALFNKEDAVYSDELNHASIIDGIRLSGAKKFIYKHSDMLDLERLLEENHSQYRFNVIITDSVFSMDGDVCHLEKIVELKDKYNTLIMLDEAHSFGIYGDCGEGLAHHLCLNEKIDIQMGTLSKAAGSEGGYICGSQELISYLRNKSRSFIFSTAPSIPVIAASLSAVEIIGKDSSLRLKLWENIEFFKSGIAKLKFYENIEIMPSDSAIFCIKFNSLESLGNLENLEKAMAVSNALLKKYSIMASCIRPPTVKIPRIRFCVSALHSKDDLSYVLECLKKVLHYTKTSKDIIS